MTRIPFKVSRLATLALLLASSCTLHGPGAPSQPSLGRSAFVQELLEEDETPRTAAFDDYTAGSYHVEKLDLLEGVREARRSRSDIVGILVYGPFGPLWAYQVLLVIEAGDGLQLHCLYFPHARIREKAIRKLSWAEYRSVLGTVESLPTMTSGVPSWDSLRGERNPRLSLEWHYSLLVADWSEGEERPWHSTSDWFSRTEEEPDPIAGILEGLVEGSRVTYSN